MTSTKNKYSGILHRIERTPVPTVPAVFSPHPLIAFEHQTSAKLHDSVPYPQNTLIFLGGLFDTLISVPYVPVIASALPPQWSLVEPILSSSGQQAGFASLDADVAEIAQVVQYFKTLRPDGGKIVLLGHSTGSQQTMHYLLSPLVQLTKIDGGIFQASASDREIIVQTLSPAEYESACSLAKAYVNDGRGDDILPLNATKSVFDRSPVSAQRWLSLASPGPEHAGQDDYFSSDLDDKRLQHSFGRLGKSGARLCFLFSGSDQYVPETVDKEKLIGRWHEHIRRGGGVIDEGSGIVPGASHTLKEAGNGLDDLVGRVVAFVERL